MNKNEDQNLNDNHNQDEQNIKENNKNNSIETKLEEISNKQNEQIPKIFNQNLEQEQIHEKDELSKENPISKDEFNTNEKNNDNKDAIELVKTNEKENSLMLNSYWIDLLGSISLVLSLLVYEIIAIFCLSTFHSIFTLEGNIKDHILTFLDVVFKQIGFKWLFFIAMSNHLSIGFFCLITFSEIFIGSKHVIRFFIINFILAIIYYAGSVIILHVLIEGVLNDFFRNTIKKLGIKNNNKVDSFFDNLIKNLVNFMADFLSSYNFYLEKIIFGVMYIFMFSEPKCFKGDKIIYFRLITIIPVIYIICSIIFRALYNFDVIVLSPYVSSFLLGPKISVYIFFISTLSIIKYKSLKEEVFDEEHEIQQKLFTKIGSRIFGILGILELIIGLFFQNWSPSGIGRRYLLVLCAPIMTLYDYKKEYVLKFPCCGKGNMSCCCRVIFLIISWFIIILIGIFDLAAFFKVFQEFVSPIVKFIKKYPIFAKELLKLITK